MFTKNHLRTPEGLRYNSPPAENQHEIKVLRWQTEPRKTRRTIEKKLTINAKHCIISSLCCWRTKRFARYSKAVPN